MADRYGAEQIVVVFGLNEPDNLRIMATTFRNGDPSFAGVLGGIALGVPSYHIFELKDEVPADVWADEMAFEELEAGDDLITRLCETLRAVRKG